MGCASYDACGCTHIQNCDEHIEWSPYTGRYMTVKKGWKPIEWCKTVPKPNKPCPLRKAALLELGWSALGKKLLEVFG